MKGSGDNTLLAIDMAGPWSILIVDALCAIDKSHFSPEERGQFNAAATIDNRLIQCPSNQSFD
jgi:hypothetical protein